MATGEAPQDIGTLPGDTLAYGFALSDDGSTVIGVSDNDGIVWTSHDGMRDVGQIFTANEILWTGVSRNGAVAAGTAGQGDFGSWAFRWTRETGLEYIGPPQATFSRATAISKDGFVILGWGPSGNFRWTERYGRAPFPDRIENVFWTPTVANGDGSVILGRTSTAVVLWTPWLRAVNFREYLIARGLNLDGWSLGYPQDISDDGTRIVGNGAHNGAPRPWLVTLPPFCDTDYDRDGDVDSQDLQTLISDVTGGTQSIPGRTPDFNVDGGADISDILDLAAAIATGECPNTRN